jgi:CO/xanthine dehydrogenase FAD-binding subunit
MDFDIINPATKEELLKAIAVHQDSDFRLGAGYTDLIPQLKNQPTHGLTIINMAQLEEAEFSGITETQEYVELGSLVTVSDLVDSELIQSNFPVLHEAALSVASIQIRNTATVGGNICNASPSADLSAALVALEAECKIIDSSGVERQEKLDQFIRGVRKTSLSKNELLISVRFPKNTFVNVKSGFEKVGTRKSMEISIVSLAYHIQYDRDGNVEHAGVSCGSVAPVIPFAHSACKFLAGKNVHDLSEKDKADFAKKVLEYAQPISDIRATEWYRREVLFNIAQSIFE